MLCKNGNSISVIQSVWDNLQNENRAFRRLGGTLCFSGVGTHRICLLLCKKIPVVPRRLSQVYLHLLRRLPDQLELVLEDGTVYRVRSFFAAEQQMGDVLGALSHEKVNREN